MSPPVLDRWLAAVLATPGLTAVTDAAVARATLLDDALKATGVVACTEGAIVDVGSGGGTPGIPLAATYPDRPVTLLEAERRKCAFLETWVPDLPNLSVVWGRAEEQETEQYGVAVAKALAHPPTAAEWCLPLVREGGLVILWVGETADEARVARVAGQIAGEVEASPPGLIVIRKVAPTPARFPRRTGVARKRPLA
ncbi:RsmG family class I SAM-dependent methyltransferase [Gaiella sp.]|uniref:16S rRNA (guanine(527)-N(7))-methyltransferase RsmG n=1 Tax=Gaiella sp. TaxID=2663207 RepID=UPI003262CD7F